MRTSSVMWYVALSCGLLSLALVSNAQSPKSTTVVDVQEKQSREISSPNEEPSEVAEQEVKSTESRGAKSQAYDYWTTCYGSFHLYGSAGHGIYRFSPNASGTGYDENFRFVDDFDVGSREGWTYKDSRRHFFFAKRADSNSRFWIGYSYNNVEFYFYAWAD